MKSAKSWHGKPPGSTIGLWPDRSDCFGWW